MVTGSRWGAAAGAACAGFVGLALAAVVAPRTVPAPRDDWAEARTLITPVEMDGRRTWFMRDREAQRCVESEQAPKELLDSSDRVGIPAVIHGMRDDHGDVLWVQIDLQTEGSYLRYYTSAAGCEQDSGRG